MENRINNIKNESEKAIKPKTAQNSVYTGVLGNVNVNKYVLFLSEIAYWSDWLPDCNWICLSQPNPLANEFISSSFS